MFSLVGLLFSIISAFALYKLVERLLLIPRIGRNGDRYILVTGCGHGFGILTVKRLERLGCHVFAGCYSEEGREKMKKIASERLHVIPLDVTDRESIQRAFEYVKSKLPPGKGLWGLLNNSGVLSFVGPADWFRLEDYKKQFEVNFFGLVDVTLTFLPLIKKEKGRIVNCSSIAGRVCLNNIMPYAVTKHSIEVFSDGLRRCLRPFGCSVSIVEPGVHKTNIVDEDQLIRYTRETFERADPAIQDEYGEAFIKHAASPDALSFFLAMGTDRVTDVVDVYEHALLGCFPRARYMVGFDANYIYRPVHMLPEWIGDRLFAMMDPKCPLPACLRK